jgi:hypothetical protein
MFETVLKDQNNFPLSDSTFLGLDENMFMALTWENSFFISTKFYLFFFSFNNNVKNQLFCWLSEIRHPETIKPTHSSLHLLPQKKVLVSVNKKSWIYCLETRKIIWRGLSLSHSFNDFTFETHGGLVGIYQYLENQILLLNSKTWKMIRKFRMPDSWWLTKFVNVIPQTYLLILQVWKTKLPCDSIVYINIKEGKVLKKMSIEQDMTGYKNQHPSLTILQASNSFILLHIEYIYDYDETFKNYYLGIFCLSKDEFRRKIIL